jgi:hypothetical protein
MGKKNQDPDLRSGMNIPDHNFKSLETNFGLKIKYLNSLMRISGIFLTMDPGFGNLGSGINISDPQHSH